MQRTEDDRLFCLRASLHTCSRSARGHLVWCDPVGWARLILKRGVFSRSKHGVRRSLVQGQLGVPAGSELFGYRNLSAESSGTN